MPIGNFLLHLFKDYFIDGPNTQLPETAIVGQMQILNWNEIESMMLSSALLFLSSVDPLNANWQFFASLMQEIIFI